LQQSKATTQEQIDAMRDEIRREKLKAAGKGTPDCQKSWKRVLKTAEWAAFLVVFALLVVTLLGVYAAKSQGETPTLFGRYQLYSVESGSMEPTLTVGSVIVCRRTDHPDSLEAGQIVTFHTSSGAVVTHRIIEVTTDEGSGIAYRTKGDNPVNSPDEELLTPDRVIGVFAAKVPFT
jgi:signal peptidase